MMQVLDAVKSAIPDAANRPAGEVLEFVLGALRNCPENDRYSTVLFASREFLVILKVDFTT
jgi:hypothetical protein